MSGLKAVVLCVLLAVLVTVSSGSDERVKLCGRELIRLAVSACGNSRRFRRNVSELGGSGSSDLDMQGDSTEGPGIMQATLEELPTRAPQQQQQETEDAGDAEPGDGDDLFLSHHWYQHAASSSFRTRRAAWKTPDVCCEKGCSMAELIQFC